MEHGMKGYRKGCKCPQCRAANAAYQKEYQEKKRKMTSQPDNSATISEGSVDG